MDNLTGFIVDVRTKDQIPISYQYNTESKVLRPNETFLGYFWQMTGSQGDGTFTKAHIHEIQLLDIDKKLFSYGGETIFANDSVLITIRALRGPVSNNRYLSKEFKKYETWNSIK
jgi:hypothetical protein